MKKLFLVFLCLSSSLLGTDAKFIIDEIHNFVDTQQTRAWLLFSSSKPDTIERAYYHGRLSALMEIDGYIHSNPPD
jgi:hypothetical protein